MKNDKRKVTLEAPLTRNKHGRLGNRACWERRQPVPTVYREQPHVRRVVAQVTQNGNVYHQVKRFLQKSTDLTPKYSKS